MAAGNFAACLKETLVHEGGWSDHPSDPGGATMKGVTIGRYREHYPNATKTDLRNISNADLQRIYRDDYWNKVSGDKLPYGVDMSTFDYGVNSGPSRGVRALQAAVGVKVDGVPGGDTIKAANSAYGKDVIKRICASRRSFVQGLRTFAVFGKGWSRRIASVEARSVAMFLASGGELSKQAKADLNAESAKAGKTAKDQKTAGGGIAGGGAAGNGALVASGDVNWIVIAGLIVLAVVVAGALILKARQNRDREEAYKAVAVGG
jgi:lysozyme family protein